MRGVIAAVCAWFSLSFGSGHAQETVVISSTTLIDGRGGSPRANTTIVIRDGRFSAIGPDSLIHLPSDATVIDGHGRWVIPGLIEVHTHDFLSSKDVLKQALALGVTSALVIGVSDTVLYLERWSEPATTATPRLYVTPGGFTGEFPDNVLPGLIRLARPTSPAEARAMVEDLHSRGATQLKIWQDDGRLWWDTPQPLPTLAPPVVREIIRAGHRLKMRVYAHAWEMQYARDLVAAGIDCLIHPIADSLADAKLLGSLAKRRMPWVTTLTGLDLFYDPATYARRVLADPRLRGSLASDVLKGLERDTLPGSDAAHPGAHPPALARNYRTYRETIVRNTLIARQSGVPLAVGSDQPVGVGTHVEMELMTEAGLTPVDVLTAASAGGARVLGLEGELGTISVGKRADLVVLRSNPLLDIRNARDVEWTIKGGQRFGGGERVP